MEKQKTNVKFKKIFLIVIMIFLDIGIIVGGSFAIIAANDKINTSQGVK